MRTLLVSQRFPPDGLGGVERYTQTLAAELVKRGDTVSIVTRRTETGRRAVQMLRERLPDGSVLYRLAGGSFGLEYFLQDQERLDELFTIALLETEPELVHINHLLGLSPRFIQIAQRFGVPVVLSLHDFYFACPRVHLQTPAGNLCAGPDGGRECARVCFVHGAHEGDRLRWGLRNLYFNRTLEMANQVVAYSRYVAEYFQPIRGASRPIHIVPNGTASSAETFAYSSCEKDSHGDLTLAFCGTVAPHKGPHVILEALRIAALRSASLLLFGHLAEPRYKSRLQEKAAAIPGLRFRMYGKYEPSQLPLLLADTDLVIVPSLVPEAGPIVPREALTQGIPVIASKLGALPELIVEEENGFTFDPSRPAELASILKRLAADRELRRRLRSGARASAVVTMSMHAEQMRLIYQTTIDGSDRNAAVAESAFTAVDRTKLTRTTEFDVLQDGLLQLGCNPRAARASA